MLHLFRRPRIRPRRREGERFGEFINRVGLDILNIYREAYVPIPDVHASVKAR